MQKPVTTYLSSRTNNGTLLSLQVDPMNQLTNMTAAGTQTCEAEENLTRNSGNYFGHTAGELFKNQPWNFVAVLELVQNGFRHTSKTAHLVIHGPSRRLKLEWNEHAWYEYPDWIREVGLYFGLRAETVFEEDCECSAKHAGKTVIKEGNNEVVLP